MSDIATDALRGEAAQGTDTAGRPRRARPQLGLHAAWWPVAHSEEVAQHPKAFRLGERDLAIYRDLQGVVRAVDDSCPHRRLPLSMGRITKDGYLQCAYHGWCFDGATGRCTAIPNLHEHEKVPGGIRVAVFTTAENVADVLGFGLRAPMLAPAVGPPTGEEPEGGTTMFDALVVDGLVLIWSGEDDPKPGARPEARPPTDSATFTGRLEVRAPYESVSEALLLNPGAALGLGPLIGVGEELCDPEVDVRGPAVSVRRERRALAPPRIATYESPSRRVVTSTTTMIAATGLATVEAGRNGRYPGCRIVIGLTPVGRYRTLMRWRGQLEGGFAGPTGSLLARLHARRLTADRCERLADAVPGAVDNGIEALRRLRNADHEHSTDGGST